MHYFKKHEIVLWFGSMGIITAVFFLFGREHYLNLVTSLIGVTGLIFSAKGNPFGQMLMIIFSLIYGLISYRFGYYGETITYIGMSMPMAVVSMISWLKHPYQGNHAEVEVHRISRKEIIMASLLSVVVTIGFYFILQYFKTENLLFSTFSVTTSFLAVSLLFLRSAYFSLAYALNDMILMILWGLAALKDSSYSSVLICFGVFLINDIYCFISWKQMEQKQDILNKNKI
ncbi:MAG: nicotinamide mononucleotide transporter [Oscillospiraceae bacterium]|nr:nicotinamide mononucleotide transporter [Oscillospiraceae bacterium]